MSCEMQLKPSKSVLVVLEMGKVLPSGYTRGLIYHEHLKRAGYKVKYVDHFSPALRRTPRLNQWYGRLNETRIAVIAKSWDLVYMCKVQSLRLVSLLRRHSKARLVLDTVDATWLKNRAGPAFGQLLTSVDAVTTDNPYTADYIRQYNKACSLVPDPAQVELFDEKRAQTPKGSNGVVTIGWVGSRDTAFNLFVVWEALENLFSKRNDIVLRLLGTGKGKSMLPRFENVRYTAAAAYTQEEMIKEVLQMDIGLFPLQDVAECRARGVLKACVYMSGGAAVVCSPVGQCLELISDGVNGILADGRKDWETKLESLVLNQELRQRIAAAGLHTVRTQFTVEKCFQALRTVLESCTQGRCL